LSKAVRIRPRADADIDECFAYLAQNNAGAALRFLDAVRDACALLADRPGMGSCRYTHVSALNGLHMWPMEHFPNYLLFYLEHPDHIEVVRLLHAARDLAPLLQDMDG
jgi:toxin ParE1/3/4